MTQKTALAELIEELKSGIIPGGNPFITTTINLIIDMAESKLPKERQDLIDAHDSKFKILEQVVNSNGATVTYQDGKNYVHEKFGI